LVVENALLHGPLSLRVNVRQLAAFQYYDWLSAEN
jgi:hypothetical protein